MLAAVATEVRRPIEFPTSTTPIRVRPRLLPDPVQGGEHRFRRSAAARATEVQRSPAVAEDVVAHARVLAIDAADFHRSLAESEQRFREALCQPVTNVIAEIGDLRAAAFEIGPGRPLR